MNKNIVFIADFYVKDILGGGELNNEELYNMLVSKGYSVEKKYSHKVTTDFLQKNKD